LTISVPPTESATSKYRKRISSRLVKSVALIGLYGFAALVVIEHLLNLSLDPLRHQVSEYANSPSGDLMAFGFLLWASSLVATAFLVEHGRRDHLLAALLAVGALGLVLVALFPTETSGGELPAGAQLTSVGKLHDLGSGLTSLTLFLSALAVAAGGGSDRRFRRITLALVLTSLALSVVLLLIGPSVGGLRQRLLLLIGCGWQLLLLQTLPNPPPLPKGKDHDAP
jgi:Protein of unknown function (DUF998)